MKKSYEGRSLHESGQDVELGDLSEQIEKGVKWGRIPEEEAMLSLGTLLRKFVPGVVPIERSLGGEDRLLGTMETVVGAVKSGSIPIQEVVAVMRELIDRFPVQES